MVDFWVAHLLVSSTPAKILTCFHASFFPFCPLCWPPLFLPFLGAFLLFFLPSKGALFCRAKGTAQSLEGGSSGLVSPQSSGRKFLPEICVKKGQKRLKIGHQNFTTFFAQNFTRSKEICHLVLTLGAISRKKRWILFFCCRKKGPGYYDA